MFANKPLCKKDHLDNFCQKILVMTPQERQQFFCGQWIQKKQKTQPNWIGVDWSDKADKTIKFKNTGSTMEVI